MTDETVTDMDGNVYTTVRIGKQVWTVENWKSTKYADGTPIPHIIADEEWRELQTPAYCYYGNDESYKKMYGALYNWWVVDSKNPKKIAPHGWRVPTDNDWTALEEYLIASGYNWDGTTEEDKIAKALASRGGEWDADDIEGSIGNNQSSNNRSGFSALPGGFRNSDGNFFFITTFGNWWSATERNESEAWLRFLCYYSERLLWFIYNKELGFSVRLIRE